MLYALRLFTVFLALLSFGAMASAHEATSPLPLSLASFENRPKLVVVLVVDQFRGDYLTRFRSRFLPAKGKDGKLGGYNYLISSGAYFPFAEYDVLQNMTGPGHSMILSGSYPYQNGIPLNNWYDAT